MNKQIGKVYWSNPKSGYLFVTLENGYGIFGQLKNKKCPKKGETIEIILGNLEKGKGKVVEIAVHAIKILKEPPK